MRVFLVLCSLFAFAARADLVTMEQAVCSGKAAGDACTTCEGDLKQAACGTCAPAPPQCNAGACRRFSDEKACKAEEGCSWGPGPLICAGKACDCPSATSAAPDAPPALQPEEPKASSCASGMPMSFGAVVLALLLTLRRRR